MSGSGRMDRSVWDEFDGAWEALVDAAAALRLEITGGLTRQPQRTPHFEDVDVEHQDATEFLVTSPGTTRTARRAEQTLVLAYQSHMEQQGSTVRRRRYWPAGEATSIVSDAWVPDRGLLIEAKNGDSRDAIRHAIGQLFDYKRFHDEPPHLAVLLPHEPGGDRLALLRSAGVEAVWLARSRFVDSADGLFV